jgi:hypothetical protein
MNTHRCRARIAVRDHRAARFFSPLPAVRASETAPLRRGRKSSGGQQRSSHWLRSDLPPDVSHSPLLSTASRTGYLALYHSSDGLLAPPFRRRVLQALHGSISYENCYYMRSQGLDPVPVFHAGEDYCWLERYLQRGCTDIGLAGVERSRTRTVAASSMAVVARCAFMHAARQINRYCRISDLPAQMLPSVCCTRRHSPRPIFPIWLT